MRTYGQFCPIAMALETLGERWTLLVVRELLSGSRRFSEIQRGLPLISPSLLSQRLTRLERAGLVVRRPAGAQRYEYEVTAAGRELWPVLEGLGVWGQRWARTEVRDDQLDPALLMWDMRRRIDTSQLPAALVVLRFHFTGITRGKATWWLVLRPGEVDVCLTDPGFDVDVAIDADLRSMIMVWMGDRTLASARRAGDVTLEGAAALVDSVPRWLQLNLLAGVERPA